MKNTVRKIFQKNIIVPKKQRDPFGLTKTDILPRNSKKLRCFNFYLVNQYFVGMTICRQKFEIFPKYLYEDICCEILDGMLFQCIIDIDFNELALKGQSIYRWIKNREHLQTINRVLRQQ